MMYNGEIIYKLTQYLASLDGIGDKTLLSQMVQKEFELTKDRIVFKGSFFAIRFSQSKSIKMSNTVLSLSVLQKYDSVPFIVCIVTPSTNYLLMANSTFLKKISHSSHELRVDNIRGSFNGSDIMRNFNSIENTPNNFEELFAFHSGFTFQDNLERLVESTNGIVGRVKKFNVSATHKQNIINSVNCSQEFIASKEYNDLKADLDNRIKNVQGEIAIAAFIDNVNIRGRIIEYLITDSGSSLKNMIIQALHNNLPLPEFKTDDKLGDYSKNYPEYHTQTDIKTKVMFLNGNPKAYNIDKLLEFLSHEKSVYMIYLLGINNDGHIIGRLCSVYDTRLIVATNIIHHWAGRNSRGVAQFLGSGLINILEEENGSIIDKSLAKKFLVDLIDR